ncbi:hypothetical protein [Pseudactinotalea suaedae]|uniref:hypothetical protein n=1 Tax=Pseudactinotalea suaedae TaxID=1524924 RepID=UPI0012E2662C|nr:hypothetical protein [Pseudactinotalea suaedae]
MVGTREDLLYQHVIETLDTDLGEWPGGYPDAIELALIDAIYSVRARYGDRERKTGVVGVVYRWRTWRAGSTDDLSVLATTSASDLRSVVSNNGRLARRYKAEVVVDAARALLDMDVKTAADFRAAPEGLRSAYLSVKGCGPVTWRYLRMLLGQSDIKPDTWVMKFVREAVPAVGDSDAAAALLTGVADRLRVDTRELDHAIWNYQRTR